MKFYLFIWKVNDWFYQPFSLLGKEAPDWSNKECSDGLHMLDMGCLDQMEKEKFDWLLEV